METNNPLTPATTKSTVITAPLPNVIFQKSEFVCSCNRMLSNLEYEKNGGKWTGYVICKCPGGAACPNGLKKIRVRSAIVDAEEVVG